METVQNDKNAIIISYLTLRKAIGWLGILFPFVLLLGNYLISWCTAFETGCNPFKNSISHFYYSRMGDVFVGTLCAVALFLFCYKGYDKTDSRLSNLAGFFALGIAMCPCSSELFIPCNTRYYISMPVVGIIHFSMAALFFTTLAYMSFFIFTKSKGKKTNNKVIRNKIYRICGIVIICSLAVIAIYMLWLKKDYPVLDKYHIVYWFETIALIAFGISWLVKGKFVLDD